MKLMKSLFEEKKMFRSRDIEFFVFVKSTNFKIFKVIVGITA